MCWMKSFIVLAVCFVLAAAELHWAENGDYRIVDNDPKVSYQVVDNPPPLPEYMYRYPEYFYRYPYLYPYPYPLDVKLEDAAVQVKEYSPFIYSYKQIKSGDK